MNEKERQGREGQRKVSIKRRKSRKDKKFK